MTTPEHHDRLNNRLRRPARASSVPGSTPVLFFGDLFTARIATVGLNPSDQEFLDRRGALLAGDARRFETLESLSARRREDLTEAQCAQAVQTMREYFLEGKPIYGWFRGLSRVCEGFGASLERGEAAHLDLVQEATSRKWRDLPPGERSALLDADLPFLQWEIEAFPIETVICTSRTVGDHVCRLLNVEVAHEGTLKRVRWWLGHAEIGGRSVVCCGWNFPLSQPTGLGAEGEREMGAMFASLAHS